MAPAPNPAMTDLFGSHLSESIERQYDLYEPYRTICDTENVTRADLRSIVERHDLTRIPAVQSDSFKMRLSHGLFRRLSSPEASGSWMMSGSTSGDPSCVWRTESDVEVARQSFSRLWERIPTNRALYFSPTRDYFEKSSRRLAFDEHPINFFAVVPGQAAEAVYGDMTYMARANSAAAEKHGSPAFDLQSDTLVEALERAEAERTPIGFSTFVLMMYPALKNLSRTYDLGDRAFFVTGAGGWDGKKGAFVGDPLQKATYVQEMSDKFNIPESAWESNFFDGYGTTENGKAFPGRYSREFADFVYDVDDDVKVYVVDPIKGRLAKVGERGFPRFISPYGAEGFAGVCVQHKDLVTVVSTQWDGSVARFTRVAR
jgi:hypothetical protein